MINELKSPLQNQSVLFEGCLNTTHQLVGEHLGCGIFRLNRLNYNSQENQWSCNFSYYWKVLVVMLLLISCTTKHMTQKRFHCNDASHLLDYCNIYKLINYTRHFQDLTYFEKIFILRILLSIISCKTLDIFLIDIKTRIMLQSVIFEVFNSRADNCSILSKVPSSSSHQYSVSQAINMLRSF